jgi:anaerobic ribonucleoside-triphosphate reductase activating protein
MLTSIHINKLHFPVTTLGPGRRVGVWFQGCSIRCAGCVSRDTWEPGLHSVTLAELCETLDRWLPEADGVTISGGEPFDQPAALDALLDFLLRREAEVLAFSGYEMAGLRQRHGGILEKLDALITGPFDPRAGRSLPWRGSDNQEMHLLSERARALYPAAAAEAGRAFDVFAGPDGVWLAGIPRGRDWQRLTAELASGGIAASFSHRC